MHSRRDLARLAFTGAAATAVLLPAAAHAAAMNGGAMMMNADENVIFTKEDPAHWAGKEATHVPVATVAMGAVTVKTPHPMTEEHFIVSHTVVLDGGKYLGRKVFKPGDTPESSFPLPMNYKGKVTVTSTCNLHDLWLATVTV